MLGSTLSRFSLSRFYLLLLKEKFNEIIPGPTPLLFSRLPALPHKGWILSSTPSFECVLFLVLCWRVYVKPGYVCLHPPLQNCEWQDQQFQKHHAQQTCNKNIEIFQFLRQNVNNLWNLSMAGNFKVLLLSSLRKAFIFSSILHLNFSFSAFCLSSSLASYSLRKPINWDACHLTQRTPSFSSSSFSLFPRVGLALTCPWIPWCCD